MKSPHQIQRQRWIRTEAGWALRSLAPLQKQAALALSVSESAFSRMVSGELLSPLHRACEWLYALELHPKTSAAPALAVLWETARKARAEARGALDLRALLAAHTQADAAEQIALCQYHRTGDREGAHFACLADGSASIDLALSLSLEVVQ